jgi:hypothetical protein
MSTTNEIWIAKNGKLHRLDLPEDTALLPTFQSNDRTKPESLQSDYSPEFEATGTAHNHWLLGHAAASQPEKGSAYVRVPCVLTSGGVEVLPKAILYIKGYKQGRYQLQCFGGNRRLVEALGDKKLSDLDLNRFNHNWTPDQVLACLPFEHWKAQGWGYEVYDRGKPLDLQKLDPYTLYPACSGELVFRQILTDAGFTADSLLAEPLAAQLDVPTANPYEYSQEFRDARQLTAGYFFEGSNTDPKYLRHTGGFALERLNFSFTSRKPYHAPAGTTGATYFAGRYVADTKGFYDLGATIPTRFGCNDLAPGKVRVKFMLLVNGQHIFDSNGAELGKDEEENGKGYITKTFNPKLSRYLLQANDVVELAWQGDEIGGAFGIKPNDPLWAIGPHGALLPLGNNLFLSTEVRFSVTLLAEFPPGGLVRLQDWLPDMKQLDFVKAYMEILGLTIQTDAYEPHLHLAPGNKLLANVPKAKNWTHKRDAYAQPGRLPERELAFRFGSYGQRNLLKWTEDEHVTKGYGDGAITVADEVLPATYDLATLPFAATEGSLDQAGLLAILNFEAQELSADPITYNAIEAKPRLTLRRADSPLDCQLITTPATLNAPAVLADVTTTAAYFAGVDVSLLLDSTVLTTYWADLRAMLDESRYLTEYYRLTPQDVAELDFSIPIWDGLLGDFFAVSLVGEYDARRPVEVRLARINATHLPKPAVPGGGLEWYGGEFYTEEEFY